MSEPTDPTTTDAGPSPDEVAGHASDVPVAPDARSGRPTSWWVGWVLAVLGLAAAGVLGMLLLEERSLEQDRAAAEEAAGRFALELTTWDASAGMSSTREGLRAASTDRFATEVDELFGGTDDLAELEEIGARSVSEVEDVLVERVDGDQAQVLAVVVQRVTTEITDGEEVSLRYARLGLERVDGEWRVDQVELLVDLLQEAAERQEGAELPGGLELDDDPEGAP